MSILHLSKKFCIPRQELCFEHKVGFPVIPTKTRQSNVIARHSMHKLIPFFPPHPVTLKPPSPPPPPPLPHHAPGIMMMSDPTNPKIKK